MAHPIETESYLIIIKYFEKSPIVERNEYSSEDDEYTDGEFESFQQYVDYCIKEKIDEVEQRFGSAMVIKDEYVSKMLNDIKTIGYE
jgi:hypothetical protein